MKKIFLFVCICFITQTSYLYGQVGIGTTNPASTSILDINSTTQGLLAPRMTTAQRLAITAPANSLFVYDIDLKSFFYFDSTKLPAPGAWVKINAGVKQRDNYKLVKSAADLAPELAAGGGSSYLLQTNTYYEINGTISLAAPIDLNDAYVSGLDANEDVLFRPTGPIFAGTRGGSIRNVTLTGGGSAFNITGGTSLLVQNTIVANLASVGTISNVGLYFGNIVQFVNNGNGVTYTNIGNLLLNNQAWLGNNTGTFETFTGTFGLIEKVSGFSTANGSAVAMDVSATGLNVLNGVLNGTVFSGTSTTYINRYATGSYPGYNFSNSWIVNSPGIPKESDDVATANLYYNGAIATGFAQAVPNGINVPFNLTNNSTTATNLFRADSPQNNRFRYLGKATRTFQINATIAVRANSFITGGEFFAFFFRKNGDTTLVPTNTVTRFDGFGTGSDIQSLSISGTVELAPNEFIEIWGQRITGVSSQNGFNIAIFSVNLNVK